jgi:hypothetical protein
MKIGLHQIVPLPTAGSFWTVPYRLGASIGAVPSFTIPYVLPANVTPAQIAPVSLTSTNITQNGVLENGIFATVDPVKNVIVISVITATAFSTLAATPVAAIVTGGGAAVPTTDMSNFLAGDVISVEISYGKK